MASLRDIRRRIKSVKNTRQITKALELVAASKMKKAQQAANAGRPYALLMAEMLAAVAGRVDESQHPFLVRREVKVRGIILVTSDMGLAGALNANLFKLVVDEVTGPAKFADIGPVAEFMVKQYLDGVVDTVEVIYPRFKNTLVQVATKIPLLPLDSLADAIAHLRDEGGAEAPKADDR